MFFAHFIFCFHKIIVFVHFFAVAVALLIFTIFWILWQQNWRNFGTNPPGLSLNCHLQNNCRKKQNYLQQIEKNKIYLPPNALYEFQSQKSIFVSFGSSAARFIFRFIFFCLEKSLNESRVDCRVCVCVDASRSDSEIYASETTIKFFIPISESH